eukprot:TRINITY_DN38128_c0_g1_i1.p1 TRINITY_DN38128_c0_g1~~TRINITY_DN38128_c0_g1_i1.p1  ORF type:complete len:129 (+),score=16.96 TRINITY_DN38128_c0_g1_i1:34-420(+)
MTELTEEQQKFLEECENEFKNRYTDADPDYLKVKKEGIGQPPIVHPWFAKTRNDRGNRGGHHRDGDRSRHDYRSRDSRDHHRDRNYGGGHGDRSDYRDRSRDYTGNNYRDRSQHDGDRNNGYNRRDYR